MEKVSVIIPVYNGGPYIERGINSVLIQTYSNIEVIVIDDGSKDDSGAICDRLAEFDCRVKVIHQENCGVNAARQKGVDNSSGDWLVFLDADDILPKNAIELYSEQFVNGAVILVQGNAEGVISREDYLQFLLRGDITPALWGKAFKSDFYKTHCPNLGREIVMGEDLLINLVVGMNVSSARYVKGKLYEVNSGNPASITKVFKKTWEYEKHYFNVLEDLFLSKCEDMECYDQLEMLVRKSQLNGIKYVMLSGNKVNYSDDEFRSLKRYFSGKAKGLGPSERLIFILKNAGLYRFVMKRYMRTLK